MQDKKDDETFKVCPNCGKLIKWETVICNYCGEKYIEPQYSHIRGSMMHPVFPNKDIKITIHKKPISIFLCVLLGILFLLTLITLIYLNSTPLFAIIIYFPIFIIITFGLIFVNLKKNKKRTISFLISTILLIAILTVSSFHVSNIQIKNTILKIKNNSYFATMFNRASIGTNFSTNTTITVTTTSITNYATTAEQTSATALLNLLSNTGIKSNGFITIQGQVENISSNSLNNVEAVVRQYDKDDNFIRYDVATIEYNPIMPGQTSPFKVIGKDDPRIAKYSIYFQFTDGGQIETINSQNVNP